MDNLEVGLAEVPGKERKTHVILKMPVEALVLAANTLFAKSGAAGNGGTFRVIDRRR
jgi:hypothetical protein